MRVALPDHPAAFVRRVVSGFFHTTRRRFTPGRNRIAHNSTVQPMKIQAQFHQTPAKERANGCTRVAFSVAVEPTAAEKPIFTGIRFVQSRTACPIKIFQHSRTGVITAATARKTGTVANDPAPVSVDAFAKSGLPITSFVPGATLNFPIPGITHFGWINPEDMPRFRTWLEGELTGVSERLQTVVNRESAAAADQSIEGIARETKTLTRPTQVPSMMAAFARPKVAFTEGVRSIF